MDSTSDSSDKPEQESHDHAQARISSLLSIPSERDITSAELLELFTEIINCIRRKQPEAWGKVVEDTQLLFGGSQSVPAKREPGLAGSLEETYENLQNTLIECRHAVAQAIATEKQIEMQLQKNRDQADTWANRAQMALEQKNPALAEQAQSRREQHIEASENLSEQLDQQRLSTRILRQQLTELEASVQKAYTRKQVLIARERAAQAHIRAHELMDSLDIPKVMEKLDEAHNTVRELEEKAKSGERGYPGIAMDSNALMMEMTNVLERATDALMILEARLKEPLKPSRDEQSGA